MATCEVVGGIFFSGDQLLRVEQLSVGASADLVDDSWLEVNHDLNLSNISECPYYMNVSQDENIPNHHIPKRLFRLFHSFCFVRSTLSLSTWPNKRLEYLDVISFKKLLSNLNGALGLLYKWHIVAHVFRHQSPRRTLVHKFAEFLELMRAGYDKKTEKDYSS